MKEIVKTLKGNPVKLKDLLDSALTDLNPTEEFIVTISKKRTVSHNNYLYRAFRLIGTEMGESSIDKVKNIIKDELGYYNYEIENGKRVKKYMSTSDFTQVEMVDFLDKLKALAYDMWGIDLENLIKYGK